MTSLRAYAARLGISHSTVAKAVKIGRLRESIAVVNGRPKIADVEIADREWRERQPYKWRPRKPYVRTKQRVVICRRCGVAGHYTKTCGREAARQAAERSMDAWNLVAASRYERRIQGLTIREIAEQDGVWLRAVDGSISKYAARFGLPMPVPTIVAETVTAAELAGALGVSKTQIHRWKAKGILSSQQYGRTERYFVDVARHELAARAAGKPGALERACPKCRRVLPTEYFVQMATCRDCKNEFSRRSSNRRRYDAARDWDLIAAASK